MTTEERVASLEASKETIFHQLNELKEDVKDIHRLTTAIEKLATKMDSMSAQVAGIDERLDIIEKAPGKKLDKYKEVIITSIINLVIGALIGALITLIFK